MPARVKCAVLGWRTMDEIFKDADEGKIDKYSGKFD
jgi:Fe-S cluster assembly protein nifU